MCGELQVTKEEMRDFVQGQPIDNEKRNALVGSSITKASSESTKVGYDGNVGIIVDGSMQKQTTVSVSLPLNTLKISSSTSKGTGLKKKSLQRKICNPYSKKIQKDTPEQTNLLETQPSSTLGRSKVKVRSQGTNNGDLSASVQQRNAHHRSSISPKIPPKEHTGYQQQTIVVRNPYTKRQTQPQQNNVGACPNPSNVSRARPGSSNTVTSSSSNITVRSSSSKKIEPVASKTSITRAIPTMQKNISSSGTWSPMHSIQKDRLGASNLVQNSSNLSSTSARSIAYKMGRTHTPFTIASQGQSPQPHLDYQPGPVPLATDDSHKTWTYPKNKKYAERKYQVAITRSAILQNTLVSLPTGLGKTLIAAVVMYNFYRWFPTGKVIFLAPTRPLVTQQIEACYNIMGIPESDTAEMSGRIKSSIRSDLWKTRRVFFCTPQTFQKDLESKICSAQNIVCVVLDEAHKVSAVPNTNFQ